MGVRAPFSTDIPTAPMVIPQLIDPNNWVLFLSSCRHVVMSSSRSGAHCQDRVGDSCLHSTSRTWTASPRFLQLELELLAHSQSWLSQTQSRRNEAQPGTILWSGICPWSSQRHRLKSCETLAGSPSHHVVMPSCRHVVMSSCRHVGSIEATSPYQWWAISITIQSFLPVGASTAVRNSFPSLKWSTHFSRIFAWAPFRGLRLSQDARCMTEKLPNPLSSRRWPCTMAQFIAAKMVVTVQPTWRSVNCLNLATRDSIKSDLFTLLKNKKKLVEGIASKIGRE